MASKKDRTITENGKTFYLDDDGRPIYPCTATERQIIKESNRASKQ